MFVPLEGWEVCVPGDCVVAASSMGACDDLRVVSIPNHLVRHPSRCDDLRELVESEDVACRELGIQSELLLENSDQLIDDLLGEDKSDSSVDGSL